MPGVFPRCERGGVGVWPRGTWAICHPFPLQAPGSPRDQQCEVGAVPPGTCSHSAPVGLPLFSVSYPAGVHLPRARLAEARSGAALPAGSTCWGPELVLARRSHCPAAARLPVSAVGEGGRGFGVGVFRCRRPCLFSGSGLVRSVRLESSGVGGKKKENGGEERTQSPSVSCLLETQLAVPIEAFSFPSPWSGLKYHFKWALLIHIQAP